MLSNQDQTSDAAAFWRFIRTNSRTLIISTIAGALFAIGITMFIPKEYKSYGVVYPPSSTSIENSIDFPNFGYDVEADRLMQIMESREVRDSVIARFKLDKYYEIDRAFPAWHDELLKRYYKDIKFERTTSMAVLITARTRDPELCANIVNYIIRCADIFREKLYKRNIKPAYDQALKEYNVQKARVDSAETLLAGKLKDNNLSSLLLLLSDAQPSIQFEKLSSMDKNAIDANLGTEIIAFKALYEVMKDAKGRLVKIRKTMVNPIPGIFVVNYAEPHYKKISPSFTVNALIGMLIALFVTVAILLVRRPGGAA